MMPPVVRRRARSEWASAVARMLVDLVLLNLATVVAVLVRMDFRSAPWSLVYIPGFPALNLREAHERPEGMEEAAVIMTGLRPERVMEALAVAEAQPRGSSRTLRLVPAYAVPNVSNKVLRIILSYTDYVRRVVWNQIT